MNGKSVPGYPSLVVGLMTIGGVQLIMIGIVGEYIGKILSELKARPIYFVAEHSEKRIEAERDSGDRRKVRRRMNDAAPRRIWLCADDYGISPGVNRAIRDLIERGRLNATSAMVVGPAHRPRRGRARCSTAAANSPRCAIGLHATLTAPFRPLTMHFRPIDGGMFSRLSEIAARRPDADGSILKSSTPN